MFAGVFCLYLNRKRQPPADTQGHEHTLSSEFIPSCLNIASGTCGAICMHVPHPPGTSPITTEIKMMQVWRGLSKFRYHHHNAVPNANLTEMCDLPYMHKSPEEATLHHHVTFGDPVRHTPSEGMHAYCPAAPGCLECVEKVEPLQ